MMYKEHTFSEYPGFGDLARKAVFPNSFQSDTPVCLCIAIFLSNQIWRSRLFGQSPDRERGGYNSLPDT